MAEAQLSDREALILDAVIGHFLSTGQPVSSGALLQGLPLEVSSATIRNVMAALERQGYLHQPHTSAGRAPTLAAIRRYASRLSAASAARRQRPDPRLASLRDQRALDALMRDATRALSVVSSLAGLASSPDEALARISHLELIALSGDQALVVLVMQGAQVQHQVVSLGREIPAEALYQMQLWLRGAVTGLSLREARQRLCDEVRQELARCDALIADALALGQQALRAQHPEGVYLEGELNLLGLDAFEDQSRLRAVLRALRDKQTLKEVLDQLTDQGRAQVFVGLLDQQGQPSPGLDWQDCSLIVAPYRQGASVLGWVGVAGPVRMCYQEIIPLVELVAREVSSCLEHHLVA